MEFKTSKVHPLSLIEQSELDVFITENLCTGQIQPSKSSMAAPVFFIKKKDGSLQLVQNYRIFNAITIKNKHLLPLISKLVTKLQEDCYFTKLDACQRFNNVHIKSGNEWKTVFYTNHRLFELLVIFFSMTNSSATF